MNRKIKSIINALKVTIVYEDCLEKNGHYIPTINTIVINNNLNEFEKYKTLLHELGHAAMHHDNYQLYKLSYVLHSKMEYEAEYYMIENLVYDHDGQYNYSQVIEEFNIGIGYDDMFQFMQ